MYRDVSEAVETIGLDLWLSERALAAGATLVEERRISRPRLGTNLISAFVGDPRAGRLRVRIRLLDGALRGECDCGKLRGACRHVAALGLLVTGGARADESDASMSSSLEQRQVARRVERARSGLFEVAAEPGTDVYGRYRVGSPSARTYAVVIRALDERHNGCSCDDFDTNRIGTCKHIEAVLQWLGQGRRKARLQRARKAGPPASYLYLEPGAEPTIRLRLEPRAPAAARGLAARWFDDGGGVRGALADAWPQLEPLAEAAGVEIPAEVRRHAARVAERAARRERWSVVERRIRRAGAAQPGFRGTLYPYQVEGVAFLVSRGRALLADDMGLGKTAQAIAAMIRLFRDEAIARALIVCPASLKHQWQQEIERFSGGPRPLRPVVVSGNRRERLEQYRQGAGVLIVNYELLRTDEAALREVAADLLILDEAQRIKNWRTRTATAVKQLDSRYAFVLSGTPLENRLDDLYSLMQVVDPQVLGPLWAFNRDFTELDEDGRPSGYRNLRELRARLEPWVLRRTKQEVLEQLPEQLTTRLEVELTAEQQSLHDEAEGKVARLFTILKRRPLTPAEEKRLLASFQRMRLAANAAALCGGADERAGAPKLQELERLLEEICLRGGHKVVVFSEWERMQELAAAVATRLGIDHVRLHGGVPSARRGALVRRFMDEPSCRIFFSTDAGGVGLNLQAASHVINLDLPWNPAVLAQRIARAHRMGQKSAVNVLLLVAKDSIEERIERTVQSKRALFDATVGDDVEADALVRSRTAGRIATLLGDTYAADTGRPAAEPPAQAPAARLEERFGAALERVVQTDEGRTIAFADGITAPLDLDDALVLPAQMAVALERLAPGTATGAVLYQRNHDADRPRLQLAAAARKLEAARLLARTDLAGEALPLIHSALTLAVRASAETDPGDAPAAVLTCVYAELLPSGALTAADAHALTRAGELARAFEGAAPPANLVSSLLGEATELLERLSTRRGSLPAAPASPPDLPALSAPANGAAPKTPRATASAGTGSVALALIPIAPR